MGLDAVEIIMDVEDHFGITMQDAETEGILTVGDLVSVVRARMVAAQREPCSILPAFRAVEKSVRVVLGDDSARLRPRDAVASILSPSQRRVFWRHLAVLLGTSLRPLRRPRQLRRSLVAISVALLLLAFLSSLAIDLRILPLMMLVSVGLIFLLNVLTVPFRSIPPDGWASFGEIAMKIAGRKVATKRIHLHSNEDILNELRPLLVNVLGVDSAEIVPSARFVEDLGMS